MAATARVVVVGSGVIGLSTALCIVEKYPKISLTVISDRDLEETTSWGPPGLFRPSKQTSRHPQWYKDTYERQIYLNSREDASEIGIQMISGYFIGNEPNQFTPESHPKYLLNRVQLSKDDIVRIAGKPYKFGQFFTSFTTEGAAYTTWMKKRLIQADASFKKQKVHQFSELFNEFDVIINCTGLGARTLVDDNSVRPVRGVLLEVKAPWLKHFYFIGNDDTTYVIQKKDCVVLGGFRQLDRWDRHVTKEDRDDILRRVTDAIPSLKGQEKGHSVVDSIRTGVKIEREWAGLRPYRPEVRLETERLQSHPNKLIIHNYGHGGNGFSLSWGCAKEVVQLMEENLTKAKL